MLADTLKSIYAVAEKIYSVIKLVQANQAQCKSLEERIKIVVTAVKGLEKVAEKEAEQFAFVIVVQMCFDKAVDKLRELKQTTDADALETATGPFAFFAKQPHNFLRILLFEH